MIKKLRLKFVLVNMGIVVIMLCAMFGLIFQFTRTNLENESVRMMQTIASQPFAPGIPNTPNTHMQDIRLPYFMLQVGPKGELLATNGGYYDLSDDAFLNKMIETALTSHKQYGVIPEYNLRYFKQVSSGIQCLVFADISSEISTLHNMTRNCVIIGVLSFFAFLVISILLSRWAVRPVERAWTQQRQFVADASHELKTPLTVILTNAEMAGNSEYSETDRKQFITNIQTVSQYMRRLVEQMLELAKADHAEGNKNTAKFNYSAVVSDVLLSMEAVLYEAGHILTTDVEENIMLSGDLQQLTQVAEILLDNAGKYATENGKIHVALKKQGNSCCLLTVTNEGQAIPAEELKNLFKRFYRIDSARSRDGSFGLGLSIAESIVLGHKGKIWAESKNGYNNFYVMLPCL
ncbi:MAG: sensor histidine kinase [Lachnospiraceae bacterium]